MDLVPIKKDVYAIILYRKPYKSKCLIKLKIKFSKGIFGFFKTNLNNFQYHCLCFT